MFFKELIKNTRHVACFVFAYCILSVIFRNTIHGPLDLLTMLGVSIAAAVVFAIPIGLLVTLLDQIPFLRKLRMDRENRQARW